VRQGQTLSTHVAELRAGRAELALDVSPEMAGTLEVHAYQVLPDGTLARDARLAVVDAPSQVTIALRPDRMAYSPGDVAHVAIDTGLEGEPVQSAVGIAVVDESVFALEDRAPGFAKLFFLLEASLLDPAARPQGVALTDLLDPPDVAEGRAAQDLAARAAWADLPVGDLALQRSTRADALARAGGRFRGLGLVLGCVLLLMPLALWAVVVGRLRRAGLLHPALWRKAFVLMGLTFVFILPAIVATLLGFFFLLGETPGKVLLAILCVGWVATLAALGVHAWRRRDEGAQIAVLLVAAYGVLGALLGYVAGRGGDLSLPLSLGVAMAFLAALAALLMLAAGFWVEKQRSAAGVTFLLVLLFVAAIVLAGASLSAFSFFVQTLADPRLYAGPAGWLSGCAMPAPEVVEKVVTQEVKETIKETVVVEGTPQVEKEVTEVVKVKETATATPVTAQTPTTLPAGDGSPAPSQPTGVLPTATPVSRPPLLGQFVPETIYWAPEASTDEAGHLEIEIPLPESPATWRLTALASTRYGQLGAATAALLVSP